MGTGEFDAGGNPAMDYHPIQGGVEILLVTSFYRITINSAINSAIIVPDEPLGSYADIYLFFNPI